jgi:prepilin-type N-terminal cleavage/methylation domain-containing protein
MLAKRLREEYGYSLVEVMAAIVIMTIAILPMAAMLDTGLRSATKGSNYDKARTLANLKLEQAKNLPFVEVRDNFPEAVGTATLYDAAGYYQSDWRTDAAQDYWDPADNFTDFANFQYRVEKQYMRQPCLDPDTQVPDPDCPPSVNFEPSNTETALIRVTVAVRWGDGNTYTTSGLVAQ